MLGTLLHFDQGRGILRGDDQQRYSFGQSDWLSATPPQPGQRLDFVPEGPHARDVLLHEPVAAPSPPAFTGHPAPPEPAPGYVPAGAGRAFYNLPGAGAALALLISLTLAYGQGLGANFKLTDHGLGGLYYLVALALVVVFGLGLPWIYAVVGAVAAAVCTALAVLDSQSLFSLYSNSNQAVNQAAGGLGEFGAALGNAFRQAQPSLTELLKPGFYVHVLSLLAVLYFVFIHRYELRRGPVRLSLPNLPPRPESAPAFSTGEPSGQAGAFSSTSGVPAGPGLAELGAGLSRAAAPAVAAVAEAMPTTAETTSFLKKFLTFDSMIAPVLITVLYYIQLVGVVLGGIGLIFSGLFVMPYGGNIVAGWGLLMLLIGPLWVRLFAEFFIVLFKIHERLRNLDDKTPPLKRG